MIASTRGVCIEGGCSDRRPAPLRDGCTAVSFFLHIYAQKTVIMENAMYGLVHKKSLQWRCIA